MENYIDIHSHILPGVDDGPADMGMSMEMLHMAARGGISQIILTPHNKPWHKNIDRTEISAEVDRLKERVREEALDINLYAGSELYYRNGLTEELDAGKAGTLADSHYVLVEFDPLADYDYIRNGAYALLMGGYYPIMAHVERYKNVCSKMDRAVELVRLGCFMQANAGSVMGKCGFGTRQLIKKMLKRHLLHFVATDAHDLAGRRPCLSECADYIGRRYGESSRKRLFYDNPMCVLHDEYIEDWKEN